MKRPPAKQRREFFRTLGDDAIALRYNYRRRFRNALLSLAHSDPHWMLWVEENLPPDAALCTHPFLLQMLEARARTLVLKGYNFLGREQISGLLFADWPFNDSGTLTPG